MSKIDTVWKVLKIICMVTIIGGLVMMAYRWYQVLSGKVSGSIPFDPRKIFYTPEPNLDNKTEAQKADELLKKRKAAGL